MKALIMHFYFAATALLLTVIFDASNVSAQGKAKTAPVAGKPVKTSTVSGAATVNLSQEDMSSVVNGGQALSANLVNTPAVSGVADSEVLKKAAENALADKIFGTKTSYEYGITYWSGPVKEQYDYYIAPNLTDFAEINEEIYKGNKYMTQIANAIVSQLARLAENWGAFKTPKARVKLLSETFNEFNTVPVDQYTNEPEDYREHLSAIFKRVASGMGWQPDDFMNSGSMMQSFAARSNCVVAVILAKSKISTEMIQSDLTTQLDYAKWGMLYKPLTSYVNQKSEFAVYSLKMEALQKKTNEDNIYKYFDKRCNCPSSEAFELGAALKSNSGSVFNNK